jgi:hypothetical protein
VIDAYLGDQVAGVAFTYRFVGDFGDGFQLDES